MNPIKRIASCNACNLHLCQRPLLDARIQADVMWVGLSAKRITGDLQTIPLSPDTPTGDIIQTIEQPLLDIRFYKTNLVKCPPLDSAGKLRYPNEEEMQVCFRNLEYELKVI